MANVLIVDDDPGVLRALSRIIELEGHTGFEATAAAEALEVLRAHNIDVAFVDLVLPGMNGIELMRGVREAHPGVKLVPMSAVRDLLIVPSEFMAEGSLTKPFMIEDVQEVLAKVLEKS